MPTESMRPTETAGLLERIDNFIERFVVLPDESAAVAVALWVAHTWAFEAAHATAYLIVLSPEKRTGKTRLLEILELLIARPWRVTSVSEAAMFRKIDVQRPSLLLDEVDALFGSNSERTEPLRAVINSGNRPGASVARCVGEGGKQRVEDFSVYCPKVLAGIDTGRLPDTILDRGVVIRMQRKTDRDPVERLRVRLVEPQAIEQVRELAEDWAERHVDELRAALPELPTEINDRAGEAWEALLAIADLAGGEWPARARRAALALSAGDEDETSHGTKLLARIKMPMSGQDQISTVDLLLTVNEDDELPFGGWREGKGIDPRTLARLLRPYGIKPGTIRQDDGKTPKGYRREWFEQAFTRYVPGPPQPPQPPHPSDNDDGFGVADSAPVADVAHVADKPERAGLGPNGEPGELDLAERIVAEYGDDGSIPTPRAMRR